ncbi:MAG: type II secretion system protein [Caldimonas sp.]
MNAVGARRLGRRPQRGVVLLALLVAITLLAIGLMSAVDVWTLSRQREREKELLFVGEQYRQAIRHYYLTAPPGGARGYPTSIDVLLEDDRFPIPVRHLRRAYPDPITGKPEWGHLTVGDRILGVYSLSDAHPIKKAGFPLGVSNFEEAETYKDWVFAYVRGRGAVLPAPSASAASPASAPPRFVPKPPRRSPP